MFFLADLYNKLASLTKRSSLYRVDSDRWVGEKSWFSVRSEVFVPPRFPSAVAVKRVRKCHQEPSRNRDEYLCDEVPRFCSAICRTCQNIPYSLFAPGRAKFYILYKNYFELEKSASNGCCLCWFFIRHLQSKSHFIKWSTPPLYHELDDYEGTDETIKLQRTHHHLFVYCGKVATRIDWNTVNHDSYHGRVALQPGRSENFQLARHWISSCLKQHERCNSPPHAFPISEHPPSRLIRISRTSDSLHFCLVQVGGSDWSVPYLTLSHCWGRRPLTRAMTTTKNIQSRQITIPAEELPKTIQDALIITAGLGFEYIWIDTLCIVQDSVEDWENVCRSMTAIFSNSVCTIAASTADNDDGGCLNQRDSDLVGWFGLEFLFSNPNTGDSMPNRVICDQKWPQYLSILTTRIILQSPLRDPRKLVSSGPLSQRGWCLQERLLSRRVLHFTEQELVWECESIWSFEDSLKPDIERVSIPESSDTRELYNAWWSIVRVYTGARLSRVTDRLPALSGLASAYLRKKPDETYLAGLWKGDVIRGLLWAKDGLDAQMLERPPDYLAPSWSWASVYGPIFYPLLSTPFLYPSLLDASVTAAGLDPLGQVSDGYISLRGKVKAIQHVQPIPRGFNLPPPRALIQVSLEFPETNTRKAEAWLSPRYLLVDGDKDEINDICGQMYFDTTVDSSVESIYCLQMTKMVHSGLTTTYIIALARLSNRELALPISSWLEPRQHIYRRVGIGEILRTNWFDDCEAHSFRII